MTTRPGAEWEEAHLSWKRRLDGYCACTAIVKEGREGGRQGRNEKRMGGGLAQRAGGHGEDNFLFVVLIAWQPGRRSRVQFRAPTSHARF